MSKKQTLFKSTEHRNLEDVAAFLRQFADRIEKNELVLQRGEEEHAVALPDNVKLNVEVEKKTKKHKTKHKVEIEIKWVEGKHATGRVTLG